MTRHTHTHPCWRCTAPVRCWADEVDDPDGSPGCCAAQHADIDFECDNCLAAEWCGYCGEHAVDDPCPYEGTE